MPTYYSVKMWYFGQNSVNVDDITGVKIRNEEFPTDFDEYENIYHVEFINFPYENLPDALLQLSEYENITECVISYIGEFENLYDIPEEIGELTSLKSLEVSGMNDIPYSLFYCINLTSIKITGKQYEEFPEVLNHVKNLKDVHVSVQNVEHYNQKLNDKWVQSSISKVKSCCLQSKFYTHNGNTILNTTMRQGYVPNFLLSIYQSLIDGQVSVKGAIEGKDSIHLYRGVAPEYVQNLVIGDIIYDNAFSSFTSDIYIAKRFALEPEFYILDLEYEGKALFLGDSDLSYYPHEQEFVIGPQISLQIIDINKIFIPLSNKNWTYATKLSVVIVNTEPVQKLDFSNKLENELNYLLKKYRVLVNTKTEHVYKSSKILNYLNNPTFTNQFSEFYDFIISYLRGNIEE